MILAGDCLWLYLWARLWPALVVLWCCCGAGSTKCMLGIMQEDQSTIKIGPTSPSTMPWGRGSCDRLHSGTVVAECAVVGLSVQLHQRVGRSPNGGLCWQNGALRQSSRLSE